MLRAQGVSRQGHQGRGSRGCSPHACHAGTQTTWAGPSWPGPGHLGCVSSSSSARGPPSFTSGQQLPNCSCRLLLGSRCTPEHPSRACRCKLALTLLVLAIVVYTAAGELQALLWFWTLKSVTCTGFTTNRNTQRIKQAILYIHACSSAGTESLHGAFSAAGGFRAGCLKHHLRPAGPSYSCLAIDAR